jgi:hypothetical protein
MFGIFRRSDRKTPRTALPGFGISPGVKASVHIEGVVFLHSSKGVVFSSNRVGASIWEGVCAGQTVEQIAADVSHKFEAPVETVARDAARFLADLVGQGILQRAIA